MLWDVNNACQKRTTRRRNAIRWIGLLATLLLGAVVTPARGQSETTWEYAPYSIRVWVAVQPQPELSAQLIDQTFREITTYGRVIAGATWRITAERAPDALRSAIATTPGLITAEQIAKAVEHPFDGQKVMLLGIRVVDGDVLLSCRELDCLTRTLGVVARDTVWQRRYLPDRAAVIVAETFSAMVRIEQSRGKKAVARVRAGGLVVHDYCPSLISVGDALRPIIRRNDRQGEPRPGGIQVVDWTYLIVRDRKKYLLDCEVYSSMRNPLAGRSSPRVQRVALKTRPRGKATMLRLRSRSDPPYPLEGYEVFAKKPLPKAPKESKDAEEPKVKNKAVRLGLTDWRGMIEVPLDKPLLLRIVYIKNGTHLIARLPIVPGYVPEVTMQLSSDDKRLEAEAFVKGMETLVTDLVARRAILTARIQRRLKEGRIKDARKLLDEIKSFQTKDDLERMIAGRQKAGLSSANPREQMRIDMMLSGTRILLNKYLKPDQLVALQREVSRAEKGGPAAPSANKNAAVRANSPAAAKKNTETKSSPKATGRP